MILIDRYFYDNIQMITVTYLINIVLNMGYICVTAGDRWQPIIVATPV